MKISEIKNRVSIAKMLLAEYSMVEAMIKSMLRAKKEHPEEFQFGETYFENITKRLIIIKKELDNLFK